MPSPGVVAEDGEEAEPDGALREGHVVSQLPTLKPFLSPCRTWPKCWVFCQAHLDMSGVSVMKLLGLPLLMLSCMAILPVSGSWKEKIDSPFELPPYSRYLGWASRWRRNRKQKDLSRSNCREEPGSVIEAVVFLKSGYQRKAECFVLNLEGLLMLHGMRFFFLNMCT